LPPQPSQPPQPPPQQNPPSAQSPADRLFALSLDLLCVVGTDGCFEQVNPAFGRTLGWTEVELLTRSLVDFVHPDDREATTEALRAIVAGAPPDLLENRFRRRDGLYRRLSWRLTSSDERARVYGVARDVTDQRAADAECRAHATLLDAVGQAVVATDPAGTITYWNHAAESLYGWSADAALGRNVMDVTPAEHSREQAEAIMGCLRTGRSWSGEFVVRRRDGTRFRAFVTDTPIVDATGRLTGIVGVSVDVSELHRVGVALHASEERYGTLLEQAPDSIIVTDPTGRVTVVNEAATRLLGYARAELLGRPLETLFAAGDIAANPLRLGELRVDASLITERWMRRKDGTTVPVEISATRLADGSLRGIARDLTERRRAESALRRQALTFETIHDAVVVADVEGKVVDWNPAAERTFGYTRAEMLGRSAEAFYPPGVAEAQHAAIAEGLARDGRWAGELRFRRKDGTEGVCETVVVTLRGEGGHLIGGVGVNRDVTDRKRAEAALRESEERYRRLVETAHEGICTVDAAGRIIYANARLSGMLGQNAASLAGRTLFDFMTTDDASEARSRFARRQRGIAGAEEVALVREDGRTIWVLQSASALLEPDGAFAGYVYVMSDLTERVEARRRLQANERLFRALAEQSSELVSVIDAAGVIRYANPAYVRVLGYTPEEAHGLSALEMVHPEDLPAVADAFAAVVRESGALVHAEYRARRKDGTWRMLHSTARNLLDEPAVAGIVVNSRDVTERRDAEEQLRRQTQLLQKIFDHIPAMITLADAAGRPIFANREWDRVSGWTLEEAPHLDLLTELYPDTEARARVVEFMRAGGGRPGDFRMRVRQGRILDTVWVSVALSDGSVLGMGQDVTERRQLEEQFRQAQKMEAVGSLASGVAHDFNNLIQVITGSTMFAGEQLPPDSPVRAALAEIDAAAGRAAALTRQLLAFSRRQVMNPVRLDANRVVLDVERMLRRVIGADVSLVSDLEPTLPAVLADAGQLEQVLMNLAVNARDAMPNGGTLTIETRTVRLDADAARRHEGLEPGAYIALRVRDTGVGMDDATRSRMFEPFFTTKEPGRGTGLGLATVHGIVTQSGGRVLVESAPGAGSAFTILLPAIAGESVPVASAAAARAIGGSETILLLEDDATVRVSVRRMLERGGYAVLEAGRAADALRLLDEPGRRVALVLADVVLPDMGAGVLVPRVRERHRGVRILLMSGYGGEAVSRQLSAAGEVGLVTKPFAPDELLRHVREALDARDPPARG
jgi:two-component system, cell cycle sensor histidine kinase and response regulator CckA